MYEDLIARMDAVALWKSDWDESKHPRADNGQFGSGSGSSGSANTSANDNSKDDSSEHVGTSLSDQSQTKWEASMFGNDEPFPTKDNPAEIDSYPYWYGDEELTNEEAPARTYFHEGVQIYEPSDEELRGMNRISNESIESAIETVHPVLREYLEAVQINPYSEVDQSARAQAEGATVIIFGDQDKYDAEETTNELPYILKHEAAHLYDQANKRISQSDEYKAAVKSDGNHVTSYSEQNMKLDGINGRNGHAEDFAEACSMYLEDPDAFKEKHPARAAIIGKILN